MSNAVETPVVGGHVIYHDAIGKPHDALVTAVWGNPEDNPAINVVLVNDDESNQDSYGRQITRETSVVHGSTQSAHGFYWRRPEEGSNPVNANSKT